MYKQIEKYNRNGVVFKIFEHIDGKKYVVTSSHAVVIDDCFVYVDKDRCVRGPFSYEKAQKTVEEGYDWILKHLSKSEKSHVK